MEWKNKDSFIEKMAKLKQVYVVYLNDWREDLEQSVAGMADWTLAETTQLQQTVHKLNGTGTTYGYPAITDMARALEYKLAYSNLDFKMGGANPNQNQMIVNELKSLIAKCAEIYAENERTKLESGVVSEIAGEIADFPQEDINSKTIMIVDDHEIIRDTLGSALKEAGFNVLQAGDGDDAFLLMQKKVPDLLVLDRAMPHMDGMTVLKTMRKVKRLADVPVIFLTAVYSPSDILEAEKLGAVDYVAKPFNVDEFVMRCLRVFQTPRSDAA